MKTKSLFALLAFSFVAWNMSQINIPSFHNISGRLPASETPAEVKKDEKSFIVFFQVCDENNEDLKCF